MIGKLARNLDAGLSRYSLNPCQPLSLRSVGHWINLERRTGRGWFIHTAAPLMRHDLRQIGTGSPLPPFNAVAHIDIHIACGLTQQYSLCADSAKRHLLFGGGIDITPMLAMAHELHHQGADFSCTTAFDPANSPRLSDTSGKRLLPATCICMKTANLPNRNSMLPPSSPRQTTRATSRCAAQFHPGHRAGCCLGRRSRAQKVLRCRTCLCLAARISIEQRNMSYRTRFIVAHSGPEFLC